MVYTTFAIVLTALFLFIILKAPDVGGEDLGEQADPPVEGDRAINTTGNHIDNETPEYLMEKAGKDLNAM